MKDLIKKGKETIGEHEIDLKKLHQELTTSLDNKEVAVDGVTTTGTTTPGPAATVAATCMAVAVGVNPWVMEAGEPMAVAPGVAVRCSAEGAGVEAVADLIKAPCIFFSFFEKNQYH